VAAAARHQRDVERAILVDRDRLALHRGEGPLAVAELAVAVVAAREQLARGRDEGRVALAARHGRDREALQALELLGRLGGEAVGAEAELAPRAVAH